MSGILENILDELKALRRQVARMEEKRDAERKADSAYDNRTGGIALAKEILGLHVDTIRDKCKSGKLKHTIKDGRYRFIVHELIAYRDGTDVLSVADEAHAARHHKRGARTIEHPASSNTAKAS